jgi:hypothetical protein
MSTNSGVLGALGSACYRHRWITVLAWIAGVACLITLWMRFGAAADNSFTGNDPGQTLLNEHFARQSGDTLTLAIRSQGSVTSQAVQAHVAQALVPFRRRRTSRGDRPVHHAGARIGGRAHRLRHYPVRHTGIEHPEQ